MIKNLIFGIWSLSFNFRFSSKKFQRQQKLAKKITHFTIQFLSNLTYFTNLNSLNILKKHTAVTQPKTYSLYKISHKLVFQTPKNYIFRKKMFVPETQKLLPDEKGGGANNFLEATRCFGLVKYFKTFHFNRNFWKFKYIPAF